MHTDFWTPKANIFLNLIVVFVLISRGTLSQTMFTEICSAYKMYLLSQAR